MPDQDQDPNNCTCLTCCYVWRRGQNGSHYCSKYLLKQIARLGVAAQEASAELALLKLAFDQCKETLKQANECLARHEQKVFDARAEPDIEETAKRDDPCPHCDAQLVAKMRGGVECPKCAYWFCF